MVSTLLAITTAEPGESPEAIRDASILGFVFVNEVDEKTRKLKVLAPLGGRVPRKAMLWSGWPEGGAGMG